MAGDKPPLRGSVRTEYRDMLANRLFMLKRRFPLLLLFSLIFGVIFSRTRLFRGVAEGQVTVVLGGLVGAAIVGSIWIAFGLIVLLVLDGLSLALTGTQRRSVEYEVDESKIVTRDALGAELSLPWSNIRKAVFTKRLLLLQLQPRGWRFLMLRAFKPSDLASLRQMADTVEKCKDCTSVCGLG
jgi:hypothetical protein